MIMYKNKILKNIVEIEREERLLLELVVLVVDIREVFKKKFIFECILKLDRYLRRDLMKKGKLF